jgi:hypothetical protein
VARRKDIFLLGFFFFGTAAGLSYGDDRDDSTIAPPRVFRVTHVPPAFSCARGARGGIESGSAARGADFFFGFLFRFFAAGFSHGVNRDDGPIVRSMVSHVACRFRVSSRTRASAKIGAAVLGGSGSQVGE